jgi:hypothetical protein
VSSQKEGFAVFYAVLVAIIVGALLLVGLRSMAQNGLLRTQAEIIQQRTQAFRSAQLLLAEKGPAGFSTYLQTLAPSLTATAQPPATPAYDQSTLVSGLFGSDISQFQPFQWSILSSRIPYPLLAQASFKTVSLQNIQFAASDALSTDSALHLDPSPPSSYYYFPQREQNGVAGRQVFGPAYLRAAVSMSFPTVSSSSLPPDAHGRTITMDGQRVTFQDVATIHVRRTQSGHHRRSAESFPACNDGFGLEWPTRKPAYSSPDGDQNYITVTQADPGDGSVPLLNNVTGQLVLLQPSSSPAAQAACITNAIDAGAAGVIVGLSTNAEAPLFTAPPSPSLEAPVLSVPLSTFQTLWEQSATVSSALQVYVTNPLNSQGGPMAYTTLGGVQRLLINLNGVAQDRELFSLILNGGGSASAGGVVISGTENLYDSDPATPMPTCAPGLNPPAGTGVRSRIYTNMPVCLWRTPAGAPTCIFTTHPDITMLGDTMFTNPQTQGKSVSFTGYIVQLSPTGRINLLGQALNCVQGSLLTHQPSIYSPGVVVSQAAFLPSSLPNGSYWVSVDSGWNRLGVSQLQNSSWTACQAPILPRPFCYAGPDASKSPIPGLAAGDFYNAVDAGVFYQWNGTQWISISKAVWQATTQRYLTVEPYTAISPFPFLQGMPTATFLSQYSIRRQ